MLSLVATFTTAVTGPAAPDTVWARYADPARWVTWAPHLTGVDASTDRIEEGTRGRVVAVGVLPAWFLVTAVDPIRREWAWTVRIGPVRLGLVHTVAAAPDGTGTVAGVTITGPAPVVVAYLPVMRWALRRLTA